MEDKTFLLNGQRILTQEDVANKFGVSSVTVWTWAKKGVIRPHRFGKDVYYLESELFEDMKNSGNSVRKSHKNC